MATWYIIRTSAKGYTGRVPYDDIVVAMNQKTFLEDLTYLPEGGVIFYDDNIEIPEGTRSDLIFYPMPIKELTKQLNPPRNLRDFTENMVYVGIVGQVLGITKEALRYAINQYFPTKPAVAETNMKTIELGYDWAEQNLEKRDRFSVREMSPLDDYIITDGNIAGALGSLFGGMEFCSWYPITPGTSLVEAAIEYAPKLRKDPKTGKMTCAILQVEDELAAIGAAAGAGWAGLRSLTCTSGPGLSLMTETAWRISPRFRWLSGMCAGWPSTGLPTHRARRSWSCTRSAMVIRSILSDPRQRN